MTLSTWTLVACDPSAGDRLATHSSYGESLAESGLDRTALGQAWFAAAEAALGSPDRPELPLALRGVWLAHEAAALGVMFTAVAGQSLRLELETTPLAGSPEDSQVYVDLYRLDRRESGIEYDPVAIDRSRDLPTLVELPENGEYVLRLQPELLVNIEYRLAIELTAALPFPVAGFHSRAAQSVFGDPRDGGVRRHEGIDIFAPRATPVIAVDDGRAVPRVNRLGGNVVWLNTDRRSYYYAHLERAAIDAPRRVEAGEVLGYVGNSGNAQSTPTHLHFGVYRRGRGAVDPLPYLRASQFERPPRYSPISPRFIRTTATKLNLRAGPSRRAPVLDVLLEGTVARLEGASGQWLRVQVPGKTPGWIHVAYQTPLDVAIGQWRAAEPGLLIHSAYGQAMPVAVLPAGATVETLAELSGVKLVRLGDGGLPGWYRPLRDDQEGAGGPRP